MRKLTVLLSLAFCSISNMVSAQTFTADKVYKITNYSEGIQAQIMPGMQYFGGTAKGATIHLGNLFRIIPSDASGSSYTICSYADSDLGIYLISNKNQDQMVGVGSLSALSAAAVKKWAIEANSTYSGSYNIWPVRNNGAKCYILNPRGSEPTWNSAKGISLWSSGTTSHSQNCWNITEATETEVNAAVTAFKNSYLQHSSVVANITSKDKEAYGYPSYEYAQAVNETNATTDEAEKLKKEFYAAKYYLSSYNITMPKEGEVFTITNNFSDGTENWLCNVNGTNVMKSATDAASLPENAKRWVVQKVSGTTCFFASAAGDGVLRFKGDASKTMTFTLGSGKDDIYPYTSLYASAYMNNNKTTFEFDQFSSLGDNIDNGEYTSSKGVYSIKYKLTKVADYEGFKVNFASSSDGYNYATLNLPFAVTLPDGVTAYKATQDGSHLNLTELKQAGEVLPYQTPVLLTSTTEGEKAFQPATYQDQVATGFTGTLTPTAVSTPNTYILAKDGGKVSFFLLDGTDNTINANKAYFVAASTTAAAQTLSINFDNVTGISQAQTSINDNAPIYDLSGRRVENLKKAGIYIQQGKKIIVK